MKDLMTPSFLGGRAATPVKEFLLLPRTVTTQSGAQRTFTDGELGELVTVFKALGRKQVIDYEHQTLGSLPGFEHFMSPDGMAPASGWIHDLEVRADGVWAKGVEWTPRASKMLAEGEYKFISPTIFWQGKPWAGKPKALGPVGLTNDPDINGLSAVAARCSHAQLQSLIEESSMDWKKLVAELMGLDANAPDDKFATACKDAWARAGTELSASKASLETERGRLQGEITAAKAAGETALTALKATHEAELTALKAAQGTELAALKATHAGEVTALKSALDAKGGLLAQQIADRLEETGRIATSDKAAIREQAKTAPDVVLTAFKGIKVGAVVPVGTLGIQQSPEAGTAIRAPSDKVSTSSAFKTASADRQQLHLMACKYAEANKVPYVDAVVAVAEMSGAGTA